VATVPGAVVLVTNGTYATGGRTVGTGLLMNRVVVDKPLTIQSVNGPGSTIIQGLGYPANGSNSVRCVYLTNAASLIGFTLTNGGTLGLDYSFIDQNAGGVWCASSMATVSNCVIAGNSAYSDGGGAWSGTLNNCILTGNSAGQGGGAACSVLNNCKLQTNSVVWAGGGAYGSALNNCALSGNSAELGGGAYDSSLSNCTLTGNSALVGGGAGGDSSGGLCTLNNCIVSFNSAQSGGNYDTNCFLNHCCTTPMPTNGSCNITNAPLFVDYASGNLRLQSNSPCINAGNNAHAPAGPDLDGNPRIAGGTVDIGAYEFQNPSSVISYAWLQQYGLPTDGSVDYADPDGDSMNNWQEWRAGTDPNNALSALRMVSAVPTGTNVTVTWQSVVGVNYFLERSTNLAAPTSFAPVTTAIRGQPGTTAYTDTSTVGPGPFFYRVGVQ